MRKEYNNGDEISLKENGCDGCSPSRINGVFCHEQGCPDAWRDKKIECIECGSDFYPDSHSQDICDDCVNSYDDLDYDFDEERYEYDDANEEPYDDA